MADAPNYEEIEMGSGVTWEETKTKLNNNFQRSKDSLEQKVDTEVGHGLYPDVDAEKLAGIDPGATNYVQPPDVVQDSEYEGKMHTLLKQFEETRSITDGMFNGSGFIDFGSHYLAQGTVNQGLYQLIGEANPDTIYTGFEGDINGVSDTNYPQVSVAGVVHKIVGVGYADDGGRNKITFPTSEQGTRSYDSVTGGVIDYLTDVDPKYGNVAPDLNEAVARNFEGLVVNSDFRNGQTEGWVIQNSAIVFISYSREVGIDYGGAANPSVANSLDTVNVGDDLEITLEVKSPIGEGVRVDLDGVDGLVDGVGNAFGGPSGESTNGEWVSVKYSATATSNVGVGIFSIGSGNSCMFRGLSVHKVSNKPIISRTDLCFIETFDQLISQYDIVLPFGLTQYLSAAFEGIVTEPLTDLGVGQPYSSFYEGDTGTVGTGVEWSSLSPTIKEKILANPYNNIRMTEDGLVQRCVRINVVRGLGDDWGRANFFDTEDKSWAAMQYKRQNSLTKIVPRGSYDGDFASFSGDLKTGQVDGQFNLFDDVSWNVYDLAKVQFGQCLAVHSDGATAFTGAYDGNSFALPVCLVGRDNQGASHPVYNQSGCRKFNADGLPDSVYWYEGSAGKPYSTKQCFIDATDLYNLMGFVGFNRYTGTISSGKSGKPINGQYQYFDGIYAGRVQDLRLNCNKQDPSRLQTSQQRKAVAGTIRGKGKVPFSTVYDDAGSGSDASASRLWYSEADGRLKVYTNNLPQGGDYFFLIDSTNQLIIRGKVDLAVEDRYFQALRESLIPYLGSLPSSGESGTGNEVYYILEKELSAEYDELPWVDIIGNPENILETFPAGCVGQWVPATPDGVRDSFPLNRKSNVSNAYNLRTSDNGVVWTLGYNPAIDTVANGVTHTNEPVGQVRLYYYPSLAEFTESDIIRPLYGDVGDVWISARDTVAKGNRFAPSLIGEILKSNIGESDSIYRSVLAYSFDTAGTLSVSTVANRKLRHYDIGVVGAPNNESHAVKVTSHLVERDGLLYNQHHAEEMVYTLPTGGWDDDTTLAVVDNESTKTDLNGSTVKIVTHTDKFPCGIADNKGVA